MDLKLKLKQYKEKYFALKQQKTRPIFIIIFLVMLSSFISYYAIAHTQPKTLSPKLKNALSTLADDNALSSLRNTLVKTKSQPNLLLAENVLHSIPADAQDNATIMPTALQTTTPHPTGTVADEFPANLPSSLEADTTTSQTDDINTPEYVVIRSSEQTTFSSITAAIIDQINVKEGSYFKKGDILLRLDCREQQAELNKAQAEQQATAVAEKSAKQLKQYGSISEFELIKAESEAAASRADVDKLQAVVDKCVIAAPYNGGVADLMVHTHEAVKPGDPLLKIVNTESLELQMQIPSSWLEWLRIGSVFSVHVSELDQTISAKVTRIDPQIDSVSQTVKIVGTITEIVPNLLPGMSGQATFPDNPYSKTKSKS